MLGFGGVICPPGVGGVVSVMVSMNVPLLQAPKLSHTFNETRNAPVVAGVKLIRPDGLIEKPVNAGVTLFTPNVSVSLVGSLSNASTW